MLRSKQMLAFFALVLNAGLSWAAGAVLRDEVELIEALKKSPPCCVIDARAAASRDKSTLDDALVYRDGLNIKPTATVVVVGDDSAGGLKVAQALAARYPGHDIWAVRGGATAWSFVRKALDQAHASSSGAPPAGLGFVIPKNTCESGSTLQVLSSGKKP
ncbi:MAG: hypothetical protein OHK0048_00720 [Rhodoferax sp.]